MKNQELTIVLSTAEMVATQGRAIEVKSEDDLLTAINFLGRIASAKKAIEERRTAMVKPLNDEVKSINGSFKPATDLLAEVDGLIRGKVNEWKRAESIRIAEQKRQEAEAEAARLAIIKAGGEATDEQAQALAFRPDVPDDPIKRVHTEGGSAQFRKVWKFEVIDKALVPEYFKCIDEKAIRAFLTLSTTTKTTPQAPGIRFYQEEQLAVSGG